MKVLFVAMPFSIHTVRWISQLEDSGMEIHLFSSFPYPQIHPDLKGVCLHEYLHTFEKKNALITYESIWPFEFSTKNKLLRKLIGKLYRIFGLEKDRVNTAYKVIKKIKPDIIHSMETQHAGYLVSQVREKLQTFPKWIHSNWGIDIHYFKNQPEHLIKIKRLLNQIDVFVAEGKRDIFLAKDIGCKAFTQIIPSVAGGLRLENYINENFVKPSLRKLILVKGTHDNVRNGLLSLKAIQRLESTLDNYKVVVYQCSDFVRDEINRVKNETSIHFEILNEVSHHTMINLAKQARISLTVNLSDGVPNTMLEAMMCGSFPIQSNTSMADEWLINGLTGFIVPPDDINAISIALFKALTEDQLVDDAAPINYSTIKNRLSDKIIKPMCHQLYQVF